MLLPPLAGVVALLPGLGAGFVHDDHLQILGNPLLRDLRHLPTLWTTSVWAGAGSGSSWYRPLMMSSYALDHALFGFRAPAMHAVQLGLYAAVVGLLVALVRRVGGSLPGAVLAGLVFAVHPANAEAAVWISARCDLWAAAGGLLAALLHARGLDGARGAFAGAGVAFSLGLFGKESAIGTLAVLAALDLAAGASWTPRALLARYSATGIGLALYLCLRSLALGDASGGLAAPIAPGAVLAAVGQGVVRIAWPAGLSLSPPAPGLGSAVLGLLGALGVAVAAAIGVRRRAPWLVPLALGASQLGIGALGAARVGELADRYLLGVVAAGAWLVALGLPSAEAALGRARRPAVVAGVRAGLVGVALVLGGASWRHAQTFVSDERLWTHAWRENPASLRAVINLAALHLDADETETALVWVRRAEALDPEDPQVVLNRAVAELQRGDPERARSLLEGLLARDPDDIGVALRLAHVALDLGDAPTAETHYRTVLARQPAWADPWAGLGVALARQGRRAEAEAALSRSLALAPAQEDAAALRALRASLRQTPEERR